MLHSRIDLLPEAGIQDVFRHLAIDQARTDANGTLLATVPPADAGQVRVIGTDLADATLGVS